MHYFVFSTDQVDSVQLLLDYGCDPNIPDMYGKTPLHVIPFMCSGSIQDQQHCVQLLLQGMSGSILRNEQFSSILFFFNCPYKNLYILYFRLVKICIMYFHVLWNGYIWLKCNK